MHPASQSPRGALLIHPGHSPSAGASLPLPHPLQGACWRPSGSRGSRAFHSARVSAHGGSAESRLCRGGRGQTSTAGARPAARATPARPSGFPPRRHLLLRNCPATLVIRVVQVAQRADEAGSRLSARTQRRQASAAGTLGKRQACGAKSGSSAAHRYEHGLHQAAATVVIVRVKAHPDQCQQPDHTCHQHDFRHGADAVRGNVARMSRETVVAAAASGIRRVRVSDGPRCPAA